MATRHVEFTNEWLDSPFNTVCMDPSMQGVPDFQEGYGQIKGHNRECDNPKTTFTVGNAAHWYSLSKLQKQTLHSALPTALRGDRTAPVTWFKRVLSIRAALRWFFVQNSRTRLHCMLVDFVLKCMICLLYVIRVVLDDIPEYECGGSRCMLGEDGSSSETGSTINWYVLLWVQRPGTLWMSEALLSFISLVKFMLVVYAAPKGHRMDLIYTSGFLIEAICSVPMLATMIYGIKLKDLFVPVFLNCWLAKQALQKIYNDFHLTRQRLQTISVTLLQQMSLLLVNMVCLVFINICCMQHLQRASPSRKLTMFQSTYFVIVSFSTVGYGDISPDTWLSRLFTILMICVAFASIPRQVEAIASIYIERQRAGGEYSLRAARRSRHVVVCCSTMTEGSLMDFLNEFYAHPRLEHHTVILLCPQELEGSKQVIFKDPKWTHRVIYMKGSPLKDLDLQRCRVQQAKACFFLAPRPTKDKVKADYHTILRSWAVKDFAPKCKQYIHLFCTANRIHVNFAEHIVCEDEFRFALLANNCLYPGLSTLVSLLVHTSTGQKDALGPESWQQIYGHHSRNEIYHIQLKKSLFFRQYEGETFPAASADAHHRFGVSLLAVLNSEAERPHLQLNPGPDYRLKAKDFCFYMSILREEYANICPEVLNSLPPYNNKHLATEKGHIEISLTIPQEDESVCDTVPSHKENKTPHIIHGFTNIISSCDSKVIVDNKNEEAILNNITNSGLVYHSCSDSFLTSLIDRDDAEKGDDEWIDSSQNVTEENYTAGDHKELVHICEVDQVFPVYNDMGQERLTTSIPAVTLGSVSRRTNCRKVPEAEQRCCLVWGMNCDHCKYMNAVDERLKHQLIILAAQHASTGIFNFIVPLRSSYIGMNNLSPIVLLLEEQPDLVFLDTVAQFPLVYYMIGSIRNVDDLLLAGINNASHLVVVNRDSDSDYGGEEVLADSETIMAVQTIFKLFPNVNIITELNQATNMRFMQFSAQDAFSREASRLGQKFQDSMTSNLNHIFRQPFAAGQVFSASMLDTLLYQTFVKGYLISFVRLLLGIDAEEGSGHLSSNGVINEGKNFLVEKVFRNGGRYTRMVVQRYIARFPDKQPPHRITIHVQQATVDKFSEYGNLYESLCTSTGEIPFAIYRTEKATNPKTVYDKRKTFIGENLLDIPQFIHRDSAHKPRTLQPGNSQTQPKSHPVISQHCFSPISKDQGDLGCLFNTRQKSVELKQVQFSSVRKQANTISYVITNPSPKHKLKSGDIVYAIQPSYSGQTSYCPSSDILDGSTSVKLE